MIFSIPDKPESTPAMSILEGEDCGLTSLTYRSSSPFSPSSQDDEHAIPSRISQAEKFTRFKKYLEYRNIAPAAMRYDDSDSTDPDLFYDLQVLSKKRDTRYVQRPFAFSAKEDVTVSEGALNSYQAYDVHREQYLEPYEAEGGLASRYDDSMELRSIKVIQIPTMGNFVECKGNLVECYGNWLLIGSGSHLTLLKNENIIKVHDLRPRMTTVTHIQNATWQVNPHTLNLVKVVKLMGEDMLICCLDDGRVLLYELKALNLYSELSQPLFEIAMESSVWGADAQDNVLVMSDNSHKVTLVYFCKTERKVICAGQSTEFSSNIPDVSIIKSEIDSVTVSLVNIDGEFLVINFDLNTELIESEILEGDLANPITLHQLLGRAEDSILCTVRFRTKVDEQGWTVNTVDADCFLEVNNPGYLGAYDIDTVEVMKCSEILGLSENYMVSSNLGGASTFVCLDTIAQFAEKPDSRSRSTLNSVTDKVSRIKKAYYDMELGPHTTDSGGLNSLDGKFLLLTTETKCALFRADRLICNATTQEVFDLVTDEYAEYANRISIVRVIPKINAYIAVSQAGIVSIGRFVKHRGIHSIREEHAWRCPKGPNTRDDEARTVAGVALREIGQSVYQIYLVFSDGEAHLFDLRTADCDDTNLSNFLI